jgi:hypothetical protein
MKSKKKIPGPLFEHRVLEDDLVSALRAEPAFINALRALRAAAEACPPPVVEPRRPFTQEEIDRRDHLYCLANDAEAAGAAAVERLAPRGGMLLVSHRGDVVVLTYRADDGPDGWREVEASVDRILGEEPNHAR